METFKLIFVILASTLMFTGTRSADLRTLDSLGHFLTQLNDECPNDHIKFWLYTKENEETPYSLDESNINTIENAEFIKDAPIKVLVHGLSGKIDTQPNEKIRPEYLQLDYNVITMDYGAVSESLFTHLNAVKYARIMGKCLANFINTLVKTRNIDIEDIHVLGFSFGAHVAGIAGNDLTKNHGMTLSRITGLDPAYKNFEEESEDRLSSSSAKFVDVVHTDYLYGLNEPLGHADFFVNEIGNQPTCISLIRWKVLKTFNLFGCSHLIVLDYFAETIKGGNPTFCGKSPSGNVVMGEHVPNSARGSYTVTTKDTAPFAADDTCESD